MIRILPVSDQGSITGGVILRESKGPLLLEHCSWNAVPGSLPLDRCP